MPEDIAVELAAGKRYPSPEYEVQPVVIHIAEGIYREKLVVSRPNVTFLACELGGHIHPLGWHDWGKTHGNFYYGEYASTGPGASPGTRAGFSYQLTKEEAEEYTIDTVLEGWNPLGDRDGGCSTGSM